MSWPQQQIGFKQSRKTRQLYKNLQYQVLLLIIIYWSENFDDEDS